MFEVFSDSIFGRWVNLLTRGRYLHPDDTVYLAQLKSNKTELSSDTDTAEPNASDPENPPSAKHEHISKPAVDWIEDDAQNPRNWPFGKKLFVTFQICLLTTAVYMGSAIYTAGIVDIQHDFHVSETSALVGLTLFVLGYALGPMVWAPLSEMPYIGRNPIYVGTIFAFVLLNLGVVYAKNFSMLLGFRFLTGLVGSPALATGGASLADMYIPRKQIYGIGVWGIAAVFGPALGPVVGGFAAESKGWKWTIWELMWLSGACAIFLIFFLPETSSSNILYRRAERLREATGDSSLKCQAEIEAQDMTGKEIALMVLVRPFTLTFTEPICFSLNSYLALIYGLLYLWFESFPLVFIGIYDFTPGLNGLAFVGILVGALTSMVPFFYYHYKYVEPQYSASGTLRPELRLQPALVGCFLVPICMFWFGWSARPSIHWIMPIIGSMFFASGAFLLFMAVLSYLGDSYPKYFASVLAGNDLIRSSFGAAFPLFANAMYKKLGIGWASSLLGFLAIAFIPIPFVLYRYGKKIRLASKAARHDI